MSAPEVKMVSVKKLRPNRRNPRTHSKHQIRQIANSIQRFGWKSAILVDGQWVIIAGHGRYLAALALGLEKVPVMVVRHAQVLGGKADALVATSADRLDQRDRSGSAIALLRMTFVRAQQQKSKPLNAPQEIFARVVPRSCAPNRLREFQRA